MSREDQNFTIYVHDGVKKLVTSSSAQLGVEPLTLDDCIHLVCRRPISKIEVSSGKRQDYEHCCFAVLIAAPAQFDSDFGKLSVIETASPVIRDKISIIQESGVSKCIQEHSVVYSCNNSTECALMGSVLYSWINEETHGLSERHLIKHRAAFKIERESKSQVPKGDYYFQCFDLRRNCVTGETDSATFGVLLTVEAEKCSSSKSRKGKSNNADDVTEEKER